MEELCTYSTKKQNYERLYDVEAWLTNNTCHLERTREIYNDAKEVLDKLMKPNALGTNHCFAGDEYGWNIKGKQIQAKIFLDMYKDPNQKTIRLEYKETISNKTKNGMVNKKQLYSFLKKHSEFLKEKPLEPQEIQKVTETHIEKPSINLVPYKLMSKEEKAKFLLNYSKLFINISKEQRIAYQSCRPIKGKFDYLLEELK
jgi:hypothetical protein